MRSDVITIKNNGEGFERALSQAEGVAVFKGLSAKDALHLRLLTEETLSMMRALTGNRAAQFWIADKDGVFELHLTADTPMTSERRKQLLSLSSTGVNTAAKGVMGKIRDLFERLLEPEDDSVAATMAGGMAMSFFEADPDNIFTSYSGLWSLNDYRDEALKGEDSAEAWDELEKSVVARLADDVRIGVTGNSAEMVIVKKF